MAFSPVLHAKNIRMNKIASLLQTLSKFFFMPLPKDPLGYSFVFFFLKDNCFTDFCCFLSNLNMNQP